MEDHVYDPTTTTRILRRLAAEMRSLTSRIAALESGRHPRRTGSSGREVESIKDVFIEDAD
jgi:hypothetical protein